MLTFEGQKFQGTQAVSSPEGLGGLWPAGKAAGALRLQQGAAAGCQWAIQGRGGWQQATLAWIATSAVLRMPPAVAAYASALRAHTARPHLAGACTGCPQLLLLPLPLPNRTPSPAQPPALVARPPFHYLPLPDPGQAHLAALPAVQAPHQLAGRAAQPQRRRAGVCDGAAAGERAAGRQAAGGDPGRAACRRCLLRCGSSACSSLPLALRCSAALASSRCQPHAPRPNRRRTLPRCCRSPRARPTRSSSARPSTLRPWAAPTWSPTTCSGAAQPPRAPGAACLPAWQWGCRLQTGAASPRSALRGARARGLCGAPGW